jgi:hypothetical protein
MILCRVCMPLRPLIYPDSVAIWRTWTTTWCPLCSTFTQLMQRFDSCCSIVKFYHWDNSNLLFIYVHVGMGSLLWISWQRVGSLWRSSLPFWPSLIWNASGMQASCRHRDSLSRVILGFVFCLYCTDILLFFSWDEERAVQFCLENSAMSEAAIRREVKRYCTWPGQE